MSSIFSDDDHEKILPKAYREWLDAQVGKDLIGVSAAFRLRFSIDERMASKCIAIWQGNYNPPKVDRVPDNLISMFL